MPRFTAEGQSAERAAINPPLSLESVHHHYFKTFEVPIVRGRAFTAADREGTMDVAIVSEDVAARTWPSEDPVGKRMRMGGPDSDDPWRTIIGVAAPTRYRELARSRPTLYLPAAQFIVVAQPLVLRTSASTDLAASLSRDAVKAADPDVQVMRVTPFERLLDGPLARPRFNAFLLRRFWSLRPAARGRWPRCGDGGVRPSAGSRDCAARGARGHAREGAASRSA